MNSYLRIRNYFSFKARNELISRVKHLGPFHIFLTLSCAEMRWYDIFISILQRRGYDVNFGEDETGNWDGKEESITVEGKALWDFVDSLNESRHDLLKDCAFIVTMHFEERVKSFLENIFLGKGKEKVPIKHFSYRVEFQARGLPHIHLVAWIEKDFLENLGIHGNFTDYPREAEMLADMLVCCNLPKDDDEFRTTVKDVQTHNHKKKSCYKYGNYCRFNYPRLPSRRTIFARPFSKMTDREKKTILQPNETEEEFISKSKVALSLAKDILEEEDISILTWQEFFSKMKLPGNEAEQTELYHKYLSVTEQGHVFVYKREINSVFTNNYNEEMLRAWSGNMDIQIANDSYAVSTYILGYVGKDESGTTKELKKALKTVKELPSNEQLRTLANTYLTHRQIGAPEAIYRLLPFMKLYHNSIKCKFIPSGFPRNRSVFFIPVKQKTPEENEDELMSDEDDEDEYMYENTEFVTSKEPVATTCSWRSRYVFS